MITVSALITDDCNYNCAGCIAKNDTTRQGIKLDVDILLEWCAKFTPGCAIHITGGEPTTRADIVEVLQKCVDAGHQTTLFTNGKCLNKIDGIKELPIVYHITHHPSQGMTYDDFFDACSGIPSDKILTCRRFTGREALNNKKLTERIYERAGYEIRWISMFGTYHKKPSKDKCESEEIIMIKPNGDVCPCSTGRRGIIGNIYDMTFDGIPDKFCFTGKCKNECQALMSATFSADLHSKNKQ